MQNTLQFYYISPIPKYSFLSAINRSSIYLLSPLNQIQIKKPITCAKKNNNNGLFGSHRSRKSAIQLVHFVASSFNILPEPMNLLIREFGGGNGGGLGFGKGFGWGNFDDRRRKKKKLGIWGLVVIAFSLGFWLILRKELSCSEIDKLLLGLCLFLVGVFSPFPQWVLGFCSGAVFVGLVLRRDDLLQKWAKGFRPVRRIGGRRTT